MLTFADAETGVDPGLASLGAGGLRNAPPDPGKGAVLPLRCEALARRSERGKRERR